MRVIFAISAIGKQTIPTLTGSVQWWSGRRHMRPISHFPFIDFQLDFQFILRLYVDSLIASKTISINIDYDLLSVLLFSTFTFLVRWHESEYIHLKLNEMIRRDLELRNCILKRSFSIAFNIFIVARKTVSWCAMLFEYFHYNRAKAMIGKYLW